MPAPPAAMMPISIAVASGLSLALSSWGVGAAPTATFVLLPARFWELGLGALLALGAVPAITNRIAASASCALGLALIGWSVATLTADTAVMVERAGRLVAAIELVSPRNKDRVSAQAAYAAAYAGYLLRGVHLLLVDVHRRPTTFSFADQIAAALGLDRPPLPAPHAVAYRVGGPAPTGGKFLATWRRPLAVGEPLPAMTLPLSADESVPADLEGTYRRATDAAYLESPAGG